MDDIQQLLEESIEDYAISRSERKELKLPLTVLSGQKIRTDESQTVRLPHGN